LSILDWIISVGAVVALFVQGWWFSRQQKSTEDYFVGGRSMNWLAVGLSIFATTFSPISFVGMPREGAYSDYHLFLAVLFIPLFASPIVGWLIIPTFHRLRLTSAYEYLERRFDRRLRRGGSLLYGLYVLGWMGSMLYATSVIVQVAVGFEEYQRIIVMIVLGLLTMIYTSLGGFKAAVWTNVAKAGILAAVIIAILVFALGRVDGGLSSVLTVGQEHNKFEMFKMEFDLTRRANFFSACAFGGFVYLAVGVAAQANVQRYVSMPSVAAARRALAIHGIGTAAVCLLFYILGTTMFAFYMQHPDPKAAEGSVFPPLAREEHITVHFVKTQIPYVGLLGLLLGALLATVMGSVSSGLNSLTALVVSDWFPGRKLEVRESQILSVFFGLGTLVAALVAPYMGKYVFDIIIAISGAFFGPLLGLFVLGMFVPRANANGALAGLTAGLVVLGGIGLIAALVELGVLTLTPVHPWWYGALTCVPTLVVGIGASLFFPPPPAEKIRGLIVSFNNNAGETSVPA